MSNMYLPDKVINLIFSGQEFKPPESLWLALFVSTGEVVGGGYARVNVTGKFDLSSGGMTKNNQQIQFVTPTIGWGTVTAAGIYDAETGGNLLVYGELENAFNAPPNTNIFFSQGVIKFGLSL